MSAHVHGSNVTRRIRTISEMRTKIKKTVFNRLSAHSLTYTRSFNSNNSIKTWESLIYKLYYSPELNSSDLNMAKDI